jgi:hypothetical protein
MPLAAYGGVNKMLIVANYNQYNFEKLCRQQIYMPRLLDRHVDTFMYNNTLIEELNFIARTAVLCTANKE